MASVAGPEIQSVVVLPEDTTWAGTPEQVIFRAPGDGTLVGAYICDYGAAVTGHASNNMTVTCQNTGTAGTGTTAMAAVTLTVANSMTQNLPLALTNSTTATNLQFTTGEIITFVKTEAGAGLDFTNAHFQVDYVLGKG